MERDKFKKPLKISEFEFPEKIPLGPSPLLVATATPRLALVAEHLSKA